MTDALAVNSYTGTKSNSKEISPVDIAKEVFRSTVMVLAGTDSSASQGSGFVVGKGLIATNYHVVKDADVICVNQIGDSKNLRKASLYAVDSKSDLAILFCPELKLPIIRVGDGVKVAVGENIYAVGNPKGFEGTFSNGIVSGIRIENGKRRLQITAPISRGSSGGPLLDRTGSVIGVTSYYYAGGQNLNFAVPIENVKIMLRDPMRFKPLSKFQ
ncbi:unnamed protein product [Sphagnum balticum]